MTDVRALLAAERQSRRITHPHLTYTKTGALICTICQLNIKSETLWDGHLRSANHKKNAAKAQEASTKKLKRKLDDVDDQDEDDDRPQIDTERRKIPKSRAVSFAERHAKVETEDVPAVPPLPAQHAVVDDAPSETQPAVTLPSEPESNSPSAPPPPPSDPAVDEDEWAAFERDIAAVEPTNAASNGEAPDYTSATISAAPMSAAQLAEQAAEEKRKREDILAEDEEDEERARLEEEFEIMEDLEGRTRRLREMREKIRSGGGSVRAEAEAREAEEEAPDQSAGGEKNEGDKNAGEDEDSESESEVDDWYN